MSVGHGQWVCMGLWHSNPHVLTAPVWGIGDLVLGLYARGTGLWTHTYAQRI